MLMTNPRLETLRLNLSQIYQEAIAFVQWIIRQGCDSK